MTVQCGQVSLPALVGLAAIGNKTRGLVKQSVSATAAQLAPSSGGPMGLRPIWKVGRAAEASALENGLRRTRGSVMQISNLEKKMGQRKSRPMRCEGQNLQRGTAAAAELGGGRHVHQL